MTNFSRIRTLTLSLLLVLSATLSPLSLLAQEAKPLTDIPLVTMKRLNLCGNNVVDSGEACDNGMQCENGTTVCKSAADCAGIGTGTCAARSGDGCSADCLSIEMKRITTLVAEAPAQKQTIDTVVAAPLKVVDATPLNVAIPVKVVETPPPPPAVIAEKPLVVQKVDVRPPVIVAEATPAPVAVAEIPLIPKNEVVVKPQETNIIAAIPIAEKPIRKIVFTTDTQPTETQPTDDCLKQYPDASSLDYKCCSLTSLQAILTRNLKGKTANGGLTPEETMACQCRADPTSLGCPCLGKHQIDDLNACASASGADTSTAVTFKIDETTGKVIGATGDLMRSETNVCACASPQPFDKHMTCDTVGVRRALRAKFSGPSNLQLACLYQDQVDALKGVPYVTVEPGPSSPSGPTYKITAPLPLSVCTTDGGTSPETQPETQPETRRLAMAEEETIKYKYQDAPMLDAEGEQPAAPPAPAEEVPVLTDGLITRGEVPCTIVKPQCPCAPPEVPTNPPETLPAPPPPLPPPPPPPATLQARLCFCRWHEFEALCPDTNESIILKDECPALTVQAFTSSDAHALYMTASDYFGKPEDAARKKKLVDAANTNLMSTTESDTNPIYSLSTLGSVAEDGAALVPVSDRKSVKALFQTSAVALSEDGTLKVNNPQAALQIFSGGPAALTSTAAEGPQVVSVSDLFKNQSAASPQTGTMVMGFDAAVATGGGGGGCGAKSSLIPDDAPWTAVGPWTLAMAALTLITWRFLPLKRRILTGSSIKTRVKGSSTKN